MAVYKKKNNRWKAKISFRNDYGDIRTKEKVFDTKREAISFETDFRRSLQTGTNEIDSITYKEVLDSYLANKQLKVTEKTIKEKKYFVNKYWQSVIDKKYTSISKRDWLKIYNNILKEDLSTSYKNKIIINLKSIARFAYQYYDLPDNTKMLEPLPERKIVEHAFWTKEEFLKVDECFNNEVIRILVNTLFYTGARREEVRLLTKEDYSIGTSTIYFRNNKYRTLKNTSSERKVKIHTALAHDLERLMNIEGEFVFGGLEPVSKTTLTRHFKRATEESRVKPIRLHDLRHSHATILINEGANIIAVSKRLGHSNTSQTLKTYAHLMQKNNDEILDIIENI